MYIVIGRHKAFRGLAFEVPGKGDDFGDRNLVTVAQKGLVQSVPFPNLSPFPREAEARAAGFEIEDSYQNPSIKLLDHDA